MSYPKILVCIITAAASSSFQLPNPKTPVDDLNPMIGASASEQAEIFTWFP